jgi:MFS family permease
MKNENHGSTAILVMAVLTALITTFSSSALNLAIPAIGAEFKASASSLGWLVNAYMLCSVSLSVPFGKIADATSRRAVLLLGCACYLVFSALAIPCTSLGPLLVMRVGQGLGAAMLFATNIAILIASFPANQRGRVMGFYVAATYSGLSLGPVLGGLITYSLGWRAVFAAMVLVSVAALVAGLFFMPKKAGSVSVQASGRKTDWQGTIAYVAAIFLLMYGFSEMGTSLVGLVLMLAGLAGCVLFARVEMAAENPVLNVRLFMRNKNFILSCIAAMFNYAATFAIGYLMSIYLQLVKGFDARTAGLFLITQPVLQALISPAAGRLADKYSPFNLASMGMAVCTVALVSFAFIGASSPLALVMASLLVIGVGFGLFSSPNQTAIMSCVRHEDYGVASSLIATSRNIGQVSSMALITLVMHARLGSLTFAQASKAQLTSAFHIQFVIFSIICAVGVFISLQRKKG